MLRPRSKLDLFTSLSCIHTLPPVKISTTQRQEHHPEIGKKSFFIFHFNIDHLRDNSPELTVFLGLMAVQYASITSKMSASSLYEVGLRLVLIGDPLGVEPKARQGRKGGADRKQVADHPLALLPEEMLLLLFKETIEGVYADRMLFIEPCLLKLFCRLFIVVSGDI